jgi:hypothetical protein
MAIGTGAKSASGASDPVLTLAVEHDKVPWYQKPNLRYLYFMLFPTCSKSYVSRLTDLD